MSASGHCLLQTEHYYAQDVCLVIILLFSKRHCHLNECPAKRKFRRTRYLAVPRAKRLTFHNQQKAFCITDTAVHVCNPKEEWDNMVYGSG